MKKNTTVKKTLPEAEKKYFKKLSQEIAERTEELTENKELLQNIINAPNVGIGVFKAVRNKKGEINDFRFEFINQRTREAFGGIDPIGTLITDYGSDGTEQFEYLKEVIETGKKNSYIRKAESGIVEGWYLFSNAPVGNDRLVQVWEDITEVKKAEQEILRLKDELAQKNKLQLQTVLESISDAFVTYDKEWRYTYINKKAAAMVGMKREEILGKSIHELFPDRSNIPIFKKFQALLKQGKPTEFEYFSPRAKRWLHTQFYPSEEGVTTFITDVTEQRRVGETDKYLAILTNTMKDAVISTDTRFRIITWNKGAKEVYQWKESEVIGKTIRMVLDSQFENPDTRKSAIKELKKNDVWRGELLQRKKNGEKIPVFSTVTVIRNEKKKIIGYVAVNNDISERKKLEKQKNEFIGIVSHELKTPITSLKVFAQVLEARFAKEGQKQSASLMKKMDLQINKLTSLIEDLLDSTRIDSGKLHFQNKKFVFDDLVNEVVEEMQRTTETHTVVKEGKTGKTVFGDKERIGQVITNLISNAIKYSPGKNKIILSTSATNEKVMLSIQDSGIGISEDKLSHIFEQFYRGSGKTHNAIAGVGIGLYISHEIIKQQGGKIWVKSKKGEGSIFGFSLPIHRVGKGK